MYQHVIFLWRKLFWVISKKPNGSLWISFCFFGCKKCVKYPSMLVYFIIKKSIIYLFKNSVILLVVLDDNRIITHIIPLANFRLINTYFTFLYSWNYREIKLAQHEPISFQISGTNKSCSFKLDIYCDKKKKKLDIYWYTYTKFIWA